MPPCYDWRCTHCGREEQLIVSVRDIETPPETPEESPCKHIWERVLLGKPTVVRGWTWGSGKGFW